MSEGQVIDVFNEEPFIKRSTVEHLSISSILLAKSMADLLSYHLQHSTLSEYLKSTSPHFICFIICGI